MKLIKTAVDERVKQLKRQSTSATNPLIKQILDDEIKALEKEFQEIPAKQK